MQIFNQTRKDFFRDVKYLEGVSHFTEKIQCSFSNQKLLNSAKRLTVPKVFTPFVRIMERKIGKLDTSFAISVDEVKASDIDSFKRFSVPDFSFSRLNVDLLIKSALITATEMGILSYQYSPMEAVEAESTYSRQTSAAYPTFKKKGDPIASTDAINWTVSFIDNPSLKAILMQPSAVFHRYQYRVDKEGNTVKKIRQVWALPHRILTLQAVYFRNLFRHCFEYVKDNQNVLSPWGLSGHTGISDVIIKRFRDIQLTKDATLVSLDVKQFDSNIPSWMYSLFSSTLKQSFPRETHKVIDMLMAFECFTPYVYSSGELKFQMRGIPSGSLLTQLFGTFVTRTIINYCYLEQNGGDNGIGIYANCQGDDNLIALIDVSYPHLLNVYRRFGLEIELSKTSFSKYGENLSYLGPTWDTSNRPTQPIQWYIARFACPSRFYIKPVLSIDEFQTCRCISTVMTYYKGLDTFERLIGYADRVYQGMLRDLSQGIDVKVPIVDTTGREIVQTIPLLYMKRYGWEFTRYTKLDTDTSQSA